MSLTECPICWGNSCCCGCTEEDKSKYRENPPKHLKDLFMSPEEVEQMTSNKIDELCDTGGPINIDIA